MDPWREGGGRTSYNGSMERGWGRTSYNEYLEREGGEQVIMDVERTTVNCHEIETYQTNFSLND